MAGPAPAPDPEDIIRLQGRGTVYRNGQALGETGYDVIIVPPNHRRIALESGTPPADRPDVTGYLTDRFYIGEDVHGAGELTLQLEDGRRFEFKVLEPETNEIIGLNAPHD
jgi:hypothetical protein